jgi:hypothetical protein
MKLQLRYVVQFGKYEFDTLAQAEVCARRLKKTVFDRYVKKILSDYRGW